METHFVVTEYAYLIPENCLVFIFSYISCVKYLPIFTMARHYEHRPIFNIGHIVNHIGLRSRLAHYGIYLHRIYHIGPLKHCVTNNMYTNLFGCKYLINCMIAYMTYFIKKIIMLHATVTVII